MDDDSNPYRTRFNEAEVALPSLPSRNVGWLLFSFRGRIPRATYWGCMVSLYGSMLVVMIAVEDRMDGLLDAAGPVLMLIGYALMFWIALAAQVKRWHDRDKSGVWVLIGMVPLVGPLWSFVETFCLRGTEGPNQYGPDPTRLTYDEVEPREAPGW